jgi:hypothetical protein
LVLDFRGGVVVARSAPRELADEGSPRPARAALAFAVASFWNLYERYSNQTARIRKGTPAK